MRACFKIPEGDEVNSRGSAKTRKRLSATPGTQRRNVPTLKGSHTDARMRPFQGRKYSLSCTGGGAHSRSLCPRLLSLSPSGIFKQSLIERDKMGVPIKD